MQAQHVAMFIWSAWKPDSIILDYSSFDHNIMKLEPIKTQRLKYAPEMLNLGTRDIGLVYGIEAIECLHN